MPVPLLGGESHKLPSPPRKFKDFLRAWANLCDSSEFGESDHKANFCTCSLWYFSDFGTFPKMGFFCWCSLIVEPLRERAKIKPSLAWLVVIYTTFYEVVTKRTNHHKGTHRTPSLE